MIRFSFGFRVIVQDTANKVTTHCSDEQRRIATVQQLTVSDDGVLFQALTWNTQRKNIHNIWDKCDRHSSGHAWLGTSVEYTHTHSTTNAWLLQYTVHNSSIIIIIIIIITIIAQNTIKCQNSVLLNNDITPYKEKLKLKEKQRQDVHMETACESELSVCVCLSAHLLASSS